MALIMITITCVLVVTISGIPVPETIYENSPSVVPGVFISVETLRELQAKAQQNTDKDKQNQAAEQALEKNSEQRIIPETLAPKLETKPDPAASIQATSQPQAAWNQPNQVSLPLLETYYANPQPNQQPILSRREDISNQAPQNFFYQPSPPQAIPEKQAQPAPPQQFFNQAPPPPRPAPQPEPAPQPIQAAQIQGDQPKPLTNIPTLLTYGPSYSSPGQGGQGTLYTLVPVNNAPNGGGFTLLQAQPFRGNIFALNPQQQ